MKMTGKVFRFEDDVNTDYIISSKNKSKILDRKELASHLMEDIRPHFADELNVGDIIVAGENFGCGSSRDGSDRDQRSGDCGGGRKVVRPNFLSQLH